MHARIVCARAFAQIMNTSARLVTLRAADRALLLRIFPVEGCKQFVIHGLSTTFDFRQYVSKIFTSQASIFSNNRKF